MYPYYESDWGILPVEHNRRFDSMSIRVVLSGNSMCVAEV